MKIASVSCRFPDLVITNDDIYDKIKKYSEPHLSEREMRLVLTISKNLLKLSGTEKRRLRAEGERAADFVIEAANDALEKASLNPTDIDLLIYAGIGRGWIMPGMSNLFQDELGLINSTCFDIIEACQSWLRALHVSFSFIKNKIYKNIMILNAEFVMHEHADFAIKSVDDLEYRFQEFTIGEAAAATIVTNDVNNEEPHFEFKTDASLHPLSKTPLPNIQQFSNKEKCPNLNPLISFAYSDILMNFIKQTMPEIYFNSPEFPNREVDICFCHPSINPLNGSSIASTIGVEDKVISTYSEYGNISAASIPVSMNKALELGKIKRGMKMLILVGSAGASYGIAHMTY